MLTDSLVNRNLPDATDEPSSGKQSTTECQGLAAQNPAIITSERQGGQPAVVS